MNGEGDTDARLWHPWLRINRVLRVTLHTRWSAEAWSVVRVEFRKALALTSQIQESDEGGGCPDAEGRFNCVTCGAKLAKGAICARCQKRRRYDDAC